MTQRRAQANPRSALLGALVFIVLGAGLYFLGPWLLPVRILEGPLVRMPAPGTIEIAWWTSRPLVENEGRFVLGDPETAESLPFESEGARNVIRIPDFAPGVSLPYEIHVGSRTLAEATLRTNKPPNQPFSFVAFGDSGKGTRAQYLLARHMAHLHPDFLLHTGDLVYGAGERERFKDRFFVPYRDMLAQVCFWPSLGNHDIRTDSAAPYLSVFALPENGPDDLPPERNYWFDYGNARIVVIDSNLNEEALGTLVAPWVDRVFAETGLVWRFVVMHHPPYTGGSYAPDVTLQRTLVPAFERAGVDVVFCGHDHNYQRTVPLREELPADDGVVYIITGAGGARLYDLLPPGERPAYIAAAANETHSFTFVHVDGLELRLQQINVDNEIIDEWAWQKAAPAEPSPPPATQPADAEDDDSPPATSPSPGAGNNDG